MKRTGRCGSRPGACRGPRRHQRSARAPGAPLRRRAAHPQLAVASLEPREQGVECCAGGGVGSPPTAERPWGPEPCARAQAESAVPGWGGGPEPGAVGEHRGGPERPASSVQPGEVCALGASGSRAGRRWTAESAPAGWAAWSGRRRNGAAALPCGPRARAPPPAAAEEPRDPPQRRVPGEPWAPGPEALLVFCVFTHFLICLCRNHY